MEGPVKKRGGFFKKRVVEPEPESQEAREAREALEAEARRVEEEKAARLAEIGAVWAQVGERIRAAMPSSANYRQAYLLSLLRQGREAEEHGRSGVARHCRACIEKGLEGLPALTTSSKNSADSRPGQNEYNVPPLVSESPLKNLKDRWDVAARARAATLLAKHTKRLAPAEREAYQVTEGGDAQGLRRKLVDRLLRAEAYRRRGARLSGWKLATVPEKSPAGPYNDFIALEQTVQRIASIHPEWAAEFLDVYGGMARVRQAYNELLPPGKAK